MSTTLTYDAVRAMPKQTPDDALAMLELRLGTSAAGAIRQNAEFWLRVVRERHSVAVLRCQASENDGDECYLVMTIALSTTTDPTSDWIVTNIYIRPESIYSQNHRIQLPNWSWRHGIR